MPDCDFHVQWPNTYSYNPFHKFLGCPGGAFQRLAVSADGQQTEPPPLLATRHNQMC